LPGSYSSLVQLSSSISREFVNLFTFYRRHLQLHLHLRFIEVLKLYLNIISKDFHLHVIIAVILPQPLMAA
jgi:hypothetical protein